MADHRQDALNKLRDYIRQLRSDQGCAWTRQQTLQSLAGQTLAECYELIEAIEQNDRASLQDELSDLLYHLLFYVQIAEEKNWFSLNELSQMVIDKHLARMPDSDTLTELDAAQVNRHWQQRKRQQQSGRLLADITQALPATSRAIQLQQRAASVGFDWPEVRPVLDKIHEELDELKEEINNHSDKERLLDEYGDLLFACVNLGRHLQIDPEAALRYANRKFIKRFQYIEQTLAERQQPLETTTLEEMESLWEEAKKKLT